MWFKKFLYVLFFYFFLFSPPVAIGSYRLYLDWLLWPLAFYYALDKRGSFRKYLKTFKTIFWIIVYLLIFSLLRGMLSGEYSVLQGHLFSIMRLLFVPFFLIIYGSRFCDNVNDYVKYILIATVIAVGISVLSIVDPSMDSLIRNRIIRYREGEVGYDRLYRGFGFGSSLTSLFSYVIAMVVALGLIFKGNKWFYWTIPFAIIACLFNARTGVFIIFVAIFLYFIFSGKVASSVVTVVLGLITWSYLNNILVLLGASDASISWIGDFTDQVDVMSTGNVNSTTFGFMWDTMLILPQDVKWLIVGNGYSLFGGHVTSYGYLSSDIGFVNQLSFGGLLYVVPMYYMVYKVCRSLYLHQQKILCLFIIITFFIVNFKGIFLVNTTTFGLTLMMYYLVVLYTSRDTCKKVSNELIKM